MTPILELRHVSASYGPFRALFDVDVVIEEGAAVGLLGSNGAGKSTIARVISGLVGVDSGDVLLEGKRINRWSPEKIRRAGILQIPEGRGVFSSLSVEDNLRVALSLQKSSARKALLAELFERFPLLAERRRSRAGTLSGGQQRLLALAPAFVAPPRLLIADELSLGLAPGILDELYDSLGQLRAAGTTLLVSEQQTERIVNLVDSAVVVEHGRVLFAGEPQMAVAALEASLSQQP